MAGVKFRPTAEDLGVNSVAADTLLRLRTMLAEAEIPFLLIRTALNRLGVAVDARYATVLGELLGDGLGTCDGIVDLGAGVELELWNFGPDHVRCPRANAVTRMAFDAVDVDNATVDLLGCSWPTFAGMFLPHVGDVGFDIDLVFSWVDGSDPVFRARRATLMENAVVGEGDDAEARIRQIDELRYALRSVYYNAPWIRRIFIATDSTAPEWLLDHPMVTLVRAADHFSDTDGLPTFNSHAVESQLHHIDGLAEHFLYSNDDMFFARPVRPSMFFSPAGISKFIEAGTRIGPGGNAERRSGFENAARVNRTLLLERFGHVITRHLEHTPAPLRRSVLSEMEDEFAEDFARTRDSRFRSATDISVTNSLYHYYALLTGRAVQQETARMQYVDTTSHAGLTMLDELAEHREVDFFCLNDGSFPEVDETYRARAVSRFLADYFPDPAPWERLSEPALRRSESPNLLHYVPDLESGAA